MTDTMDKSGNGMLFESQDRALAQANKMNAENTDQFTSSHWSEPNVLTHVRLNDRTYNGKPVTFIEEIQSDWAADVRKEGAKKIYTEIPQGMKIRDFCVYFPCGFHSILSTCLLK